jgi:Secretion system C-terminal sorting domain/WD40-like Beta Propeller Repeat
MKRFLTILLTWHFVFSAYAQNILTNGGFETDQDYRVCGGATIVKIGNQGIDGRMVRSGNRAIKFSRNGSCGSDPIFDNLSNLEINFTVPSTGTALTFDLYYSRVGNPLNRLGMGLITVDNQTTQSQSFPDLKVLNLEGWHNYKYILEGSNFEKLKGREVKIFFSMTPLFTDNTANTPLEGLVGRPESGFYIDDVSIKAGKINVLPQANVAGLNRYANNPICFLDYETNTFSRINADGTSKTAFAPFGSRNPIGPVWLPDGKSICYFEETIQTTSSSEVNPAFIYILYAVNQNGQNRRELLRSTGINGREPLNPTPTDPKTPALDVQLSQLRFSASGKYFSLTRSSRQRFKNGVTQDASSKIEIYETVGLKLLRSYESGFNATWVGDNEIVYFNNDAYQSKPQGVYRVSDVLAGTEQLVIPGTGGLFGFSLYQEQGVSVSPDGRYISTLRYIDGYFTNPQGNYYAPTALMLFDKNENYRPRQLLLFDHGTTGNGYHTWSPDGKFICYHLQVANSDFDSWWLEVATGKTGKITNNKSTLYPSWFYGSASTSTHELEKERLESFEIYPNPSLGSMLYLKTTVPTNAIRRIGLYDATGHFIQNFEITSQNNLIQLDNLNTPSGLYFLEIETNTGRFSKKIIRL